MQSIKKYLLLSIFTSISAALLAQPSINSSVIPVVGDSSIMTVDTILQSEGSSGANVTWNFTTLQNNYSVTRLYKLPSQTPYDSVCLGANMVRTDDVGSIYTFWNSGGSNLTYYGFIETGIQSQTYNVNPIDYYHFPINYNDAFTDSLTSFTIPGALVGDGIYSFNADAYGTLQLPNQTFSNTLRVKSVYYIGDSLIGSYSLTTEFAWFKANTKEPLLVIEKVIVDSALVVGYMLFNNSAPTGITTTDTNTPSVQLMPNPATDKLFIYSNEIISQPITFTSMLGQTFQAEQLNNSQGVEMDVSALQTGFYFATIKFQNGLFTTRKFIKQ